MTLIEAAVVIVIIGILSVVSAVAFPFVRARQALASDAQKIEAAARDAQLRSLNEERSQECLDRAGASEESQRNCSNVGIALRSGVMILFADLNGDQFYTTAQDVDIQEYELNSQIEDTSTTSWKSFVYEATPPTITLYGNGQVIPAPSSPDIPPPLNTRIQLSVGNHSHVLALHPYGVIQ